MRLYLVQHAEAVPKDIDSNRPLSDKGAEDARRVAAFLGESGVRVARVLHSGKRRAAETAALLAKRVSPDREAEAVAGLDPNDPTEGLAERASRWEEDTLLVGHLPFMDRLTTRLVTGRGGGSTVSFTPGSVVCLERDEAGSWIIAWMLRPELLP